jgi:hypothetical protein
VHGLMATPFFRNAWGESVGATLLRKLFTFGQSGSQPLVFALFLVNFRQLGLRKPIRSGEIWRPDGPGAILGWDQRGRHGFDGSCRGSKACRAPPARNRVEQYNCQYAVASRCLTKIK